jgi:hypothetical protein
MGSEWRYKHFLDKARYSEPRKLSYVYCKIQWIRTHMCNAIPHISVLSLNPWRLLVFGMALYDLYLYSIIPK